nr:probable disease resistance protein At5g66900 [Quercus suber]
MALFVAWPLLGAGFGQVLTSLRETVKDVVRNARQFKRILNRLDSTLDLLAQAVEDIERSNQQRGRAVENTQGLIEEMTKGRELVDLQLHGARTVLETREIVSGNRERVEDVTVEGGGAAASIDCSWRMWETTLVKMLCQDKEIKGTFKENILFVNVSKTLNVKVIVQILFSHKRLQPMFEIQSDEDAIEQLQQLLEHIGSDPILLILDDVWLGSESLPEKFGFKTPNHKIMVTSRTAFPRFKFTYNLNPLNDKDAMTLFRHSASLQDGWSNIPEEDIKKIVKGCGGFHWLLNSDTELLGQLQKRLEFQDDKVIKDCFMDLGSFPEDQRIYAAALINMWAKLYELDEDGIHAIANLQELTTRNLANLVMAR